ncbi:hypothetical protein GCM10025876_14530 [Demequina litorisediminis]|uniref:Toprim domain-containing protein n=1 Tax=Demequina litorisediminis TaxID=1849022 RepID=A0ABQ6IEU5_9MICO|nr:hypothetical protein GCM10025876_14530 [Demequina litorisediminis]
MACQDAAPTEGRNPWPTRLVIVESPTKAGTIGGYLGSDYEVVSSVGHIRDIPEPKEMPAEVKKGPFGKYGVDVDNGFEPYYQVSVRSKKIVADIKKKAEGRRRGSTSRLMRTARERPSPGTCSRCSSPRFP